ncbi:MAG: hypothetical protein KF764_01465 [Labilithrix sp.]|nr:hypothetical protein [Labilithrix sp.]MBX3220556.1 hypothetical protein [Labilithrix sp.]
MRSPLPSLVSSLAAVLVLVSPLVARAQEEPEPEAPAPSPEPETVPEPSPEPETPTLPPFAPPPQESPPAEASLSPSDIPEPMSEGRTLVSLYNSGFQWGIAPGVVFSRGKAGFAVGLRFGYGFDLDSVIVVPGVRLAGYFIDPNVYLGMPTFKIVLPIDRFAPFVEGGAGVGHVDGDAAAKSANGVALMGGGGFMIHFRPIAIGAEASYQVITGTRFRGFGVGPILALGF